MFYSKTTGAFYDRAIHGNNIPADAVEISNEDYRALIDGQSAGKRIVADAAGRPVLVDPPPPSQDQIISAFTAQIQARLDVWARTRNYDGILSACTYATSGVAKFAAEGQRAVDLRDQTWAAAYTILDDVLANRRSMPASIADIEDDLPALEWPA